MTEEQKDIFISRMLECHAKLSDAEISQILEDDELREIYCIAVDVKVAKSNEARLDAAAEWQRLKPRLSRHSPWTFRRLSSAAAIFIGVLLVGASVIFLTGREPITEPTPLANNDSPVHGTVPVATEKDTLESSASTPSHTRTASYARGSKTIAPGTSSDQEVALPQNLDVEEYMRIQQARMDNDLAMERAEAMVNQYYTVAEGIGGIPADGAYAYPIDEEILTFIIP